MATIALGSITTTAAQDTALSRLLNRQNAENAPTPTTPGTGYSVGDVLTAIGGTFTTAMQFTVRTALGGAIQAVDLTNPGVYSVRPTSPISVTGGTGSGATFTLQFDDILPMLRGLLAQLIIQDARRQYLSDVQGVIQAALPGATAAQLASIATTLGVSLPQ